MKKFILFFALFFSMQTIFAQENIAEARTMAIGESVTITGIVINGSEMGSIRYVQDETAGIAAYGSQLSDVERGDEVTITGVLKDYNQLLEIDPITNITINSSDNDLPTPLEIVPSELSESNEGELVQINDIIFDNGGGVFSSNTAYSFSNGTEISSIYVNSNSSLIDEIVPNGVVNITGISSQYSYSDPNGGYQLLLRDYNDIQNTSSIIITTPLKVTNITTTGFDISWETDVAGSTNLFYGKTMDLELGELNNEQVGTHHDIQITGVNPSDIIYVKVFSILGEDTVFSNIRPFITASNSTGDIKAYFTTDVEHSVSNGENAISLPQAVDDTLISYINRAKYSVDLCVYNFNNDGISNISNALNTAANNGVQVRVIYGGSSANLGIGQLGGNVPRLASPEGSEYGIMHNKFLIIDANSENPNDPILWTGSTNLTKGNINQDANNVIIFQDQSIAKVYQIEFNEMWGSETNEANSENAKFGIYKTNNTPHHLLIGGKKVECYFSPSDITNSHIIKNIEEAEEEILIQTMLITRSDIAYAISNAVDNNINTFIIVNSLGECSENVVNILTDDLGDNFVSDTEVPGTMHNKLMIVDRNGANPKVLTGSHNWSNSANNKNDENTVIIHDETLANIYFQEFIHSYSANGGTVSAENLSIENNNLLIFPNPSNDIFNIQLEKAEKINIEVIDLLGKKIMNKISFDKKINIDLSNQNKGIYFLKVETKNKTYCKKLILN